MGLLINAESNMVYKDPEKERQWYEANREKRRIQAKEWYKANKEKKKERRSQYRKNNPEKVKQQDKRYREARAEENRLYRETNREKQRQYSIEYRRARLQECRERDAKYRETHKSQKREYDKEYYRRNKNRDRTRREKYYSSHKDKIILSVVKYERSRLSKDPILRLIKSHRSRISAVLKSHCAEKAQSSLTQLGCTPLEFKTYLESKFQPGMSWDNHGFYGWHVDHIRPLASFDLTDPAQQAIAFHYTNTQPLWAKDNLEKGAKN